MKIDIDSVLSKLDPKTRKATLELDAAVDALRFWVRLGTKDKCIPPTAAGDGTSVMILRKLKLKLDHYKLKIQELKQS